jgi:ribonuclease PH
MRKDGRAHDELRQIRMTTQFNIHAEGSVLIEVGNTKVICTATVEEKVPQFLRGQGRGWINAEYSMLPRATHDRNQRESAKGRQSGRTMEIQRLIARSLRTVVDLKALGERMITVDCDVIQADGGTRTAAITGGFVAMAMAIDGLVKKQAISKMPITDFLASISIGTIAGSTLLDLNYLEDSNAQVDMNVVMTGEGAFVEVQGTGEQTPFTKSQLQQMLDLAELGIRQCIEQQKQALGEIAHTIGGNAHARVL